MESEDPGSKSQSGIRHSFLINEIPWNQKGLLASEQRDSHQDQNGVTYVSDLCYLEEASPMRAVNLVFGDFFSGYRIILGLLKPMQIYTQGSKVNKDSSPDL